MNYKLIIPLILNFILFTLICMFVCGVVNAEEHDPHRLGVMPSIGYLIPEKEFFEPINRNIEFSDASSSIDFNRNPELQSFTASVEDGEIIFNVRKKEEFDPNCSCAPCLL